MVRNRRSIRLPGYDYSKGGYYSVTICIQNRLNLLGKIVDGEMILNLAGKMIKNLWCQIPEKYPGVDIDEYIFMPNHMHGIVIVGTESNVKPMVNVNGQARGPAPTPILSLPDVVHRFKSFSTHEYKDRIRQHKWPIINKRLWQRNYYEHIIRNDQDCQTIRRYIQDNPKNWERDKLWAG